jgi:hypothetical protein
MALAMAVGERDVFGNLDTGLLVLAQDITENIFTAAL